jgi:hypothetical protein
VLGIWCIVSLVCCGCSCVAVAEVVRGRALDEGAVQRLPALWQSAFRVRDDIKESVRLAADATCRALMKVSDNRQREHNGPTHTHTNYRN